MRNPLTPIQNVDIKFVFIDLKLESLAHDQFLLIDSDSEPDSAIQDYFHRCVQFDCTQTLTIIE